MAVVPVGLAGWRFRFLWRRCPIHMVASVTWMAVIALVILGADRVSASPRGLPGPPSGPGSKALLELARSAGPGRYRYALDQGARLGYSRDGKTFWVLWMPKARAPTGNGRLIATLHGHASTAFDEFFLWHRHAAARSMGVLAIQWWLGKGERFQDYLAPHEIYRTIDDVLQELSTAPGQVLLHGFSRGSANCYAVAALDRHARKDHFGLILANAGKPGLDFPSNVAIERGDFGPRPFSRTSWMLYCGANDSNPGRDGCEGMAHARDWVTKYGGQVVLFLRDPTGDHGGFHRNPKNIAQALDVFDRLASSITHQDPPSGP